MWKGHDMLIRAECMMLHDDPSCEEARCLEVEKKGVDGFKE
jgi:hypothetical protein